MGMIPCGGVALGSDANGQSHPGQVTAHGDGFGAAGRLRGRAASKVECSLQLRRRVSCRDWRTASRDLVWKFDVAEVGDQDVWRAIGQLLQRETERLQSGVGLVDRQIYCGPAEAFGAAGRGFYRGIARVRIRDRAHDSERRPRCCRTAVCWATLPCRVPARSRPTEDDRSGYRTYLRQPPHSWHTCRARRRWMISRYSQNWSRSFRTMLRSPERVAKAAFRAPDPVSAARPVRCELQCRRRAIGIQRARIAGGAFGCRNRQFRCGSDSDRSQASSEL